MLVPVCGSTIVGVMARYGSERIRGHGIPEALESILIHGSRVQPRLAYSSQTAIVGDPIGTGGPFGAEGPIIVTGERVWIDARAILSLDGASSVRLCWWQRRRRDVGDFCRACRSESS